MIEIRNWGDEVAVYTNDNAMAYKLGQRKTLLGITDYEQEQYSKRRVGIVGKDFFFPKKETKRLLRIEGITEDDGFKHRKFRQAARKGH